MVLFDKSVFSILVVVLRKFDTKFAVSLIFNLFDSIDAVSLIFNLFDSIAAVSLILSRLEKVPNVSLIFNFRFNAFCVAILIGFLKSVVLSTESIKRFFLASDVFDAPVPPLAIATIPFTFFAFPIISPIIFEPLTDSIFISVIL